MLKNIHPMILSSSGLLTKRYLLWPLKIPTYWSNMCTRSSQEEKRDLAMPVLISINPRVNINAAS